MGGEEPKSLKKPNATIQDYALIHMHFFENVERFPFDYLITTIFIPGLALTAGAVKFSILGTFLPPMQNKVLLELFLGALIFGYSVFAFSPVVASIVESREPVRVVPRLVFL